MACELLGRGRCRPQCLYARAASWFAPPLTGCRPVSLSLLPAAFRAHLPAAPGAGVSLSSCGHGPASLGRPSP
eukprot:7968263-Alexandrium_andersonii.AAC.1